ncbi:MAG: A/G-specific adenine glycosylase, partial [Anaerolineales bacterium]
MTSALSDRLLNWYAQNARPLPWRINPHPYYVWISEIMLQQTKVETVLPYFERWLERFPDVSTLARANQSEVLQVWEGLGYYARARNLHRAAQQVVHLYNGELPKDPKTLKSLPGIGAYTANANASIAFQQNVATLDGNIMRVMARLMALNMPTKSKIAQQSIYDFATDLLPDGQAGLFNQALMELGALI